QGGAEGDEPPRPRSPPLTDASPRCHSSFTGPGWAPATMTAAGEPDVEKVTSRLSEPPRAPSAHFPGHTAPGPFRDPGAGRNRGPVLEVAFRPASRRGNRPPRRAAGARRGAGDFHCPGLAGLLRSGRLESSSVPRTAGGDAPPQRLACHSSGGVLFPARWSA